MCGRQQIDVEVNRDRSSYLLKTKTSIMELEKNQKLFWSDCTILNRIIDDERQIEVLAGESDYGSDGFVAVLSNKSKKLKWIAFFSSSNPFSRLEIENNQILAKSTSGFSWIFPIDMPEAVVVFGEA